MMKIIKERLSDPFFGIYIVSWILFNWKFVLVLSFGQVDIVNRIKYLEDTYFASGCQVFLAFAIPFVITSIWFFGYPYLRRFLTTFYESQVAYLRKLKLDISQKAEYEENTKKLNNDRNRLKAADYILFTLYNRHRKDFDISGIQLVYCADGEVGDWVNVQNYSAKLANCSEKDPVWANAIIIEKLINGFVIIQQAGEVDWAYLANRFKNREENGTDFFLSDSPGEMVTKTMAQKEQNQHLGRYFSTGKSSPYFKIELQLQ